MKSIFGIAIAAVCVLSAASAGAQNLVTNGNFDQVTSPTGVAQTTLDNYMINSTVYNPGWGFNMTGWTNSSYYAVVYGSGISDDPAHDAIRSDGQGRQPSTRLAGSQSNPNWPVLPAESPQGGNFFGANGNYNPGALTQTVSGLVVGQAYTLSFWSAAAVSTAGVFVGGPQLTGSWNVTLQGAGQDVNQTVTSSTFGPVGGYSPWVQTVINFTASASSEVLSFMPGGTAPPMNLLDGVAIMAGSNVVPVPEPRQWLMLCAGLAVLGGLRLRSRSR